MAKILMMSERRVIGTTPIFVCGYRTWRLPFIARFAGATEISLVIYDESAGFIGHVHGLFRSAVRINPTGVRVRSEVDRSILGLSSRLPECQSPALRV